MCSQTHKGAFDPEELGALQSVFNELTVQPWFDTFAHTTFDPDKHRSVIEASARMFYAKGAF
ncbi:hypothetical protein MNR02_20720 (plasmid) [Shinella sp. H4-D48]|uniref:hypothetical protein n=1 Tax=Shinella sp. H4-D48 TaxID=2925841 RepID=UPI001F53082F|nr:hypothetical protein [Shinella sp. H4-D48]UNK40160.1 hypothetical protein MNR02_20720 [Shinella sp. H4-D48]